MKLSFDRSTGVNRPLSKKDFEIIARWEKERADGKWFWIFKRAAAWLFTAIVLYGATQFFAPQLISFDGNQIYIAVFMFGGFFAGSVLEWSKMEDFYQKNSVTADQSA